MDKDQVVHDLAMLILEPYVRLHFKDDLKDNNAEPDFTRLVDESVMDYKNLCELISKSLDD